MKFLDSDKKTPIVIFPEDIGASIEAWTKENEQEFSEYLRDYGAILFRKFKINGARSFQRIVEDIGGEMLEYKNRSTPRSVVREKVYTSTEYPPAEEIPLHNENAYTNAWPKKIYFFCLKASETGGETPIADSRRVYQKIDKSIRDEFEQKGVMYVRNYGVLDLPWQEVFQTEDANQAEAICRSSGIEFDWINGTALRTKQVCQASLSHPETQEKVWFNQAHLFHYSNLREEVSQSLLESVGEENLPRNAYYGDGSPIDSSYLAEIRKIYNDEEITFPWISGDMLVMDNMLMCHGRKAFTGNRKVLVGMTDEMAQA